jgi:hypothetical protein
MQELWRWIKAVGPYHRSCLVIDPDLPEVLGITQGLSERSMEHEGTVDIALDTVVECDPNAIAV